MGTVLDSSVIIAGERGKIDLDHVLAEYSDESLVLSVITVSELLHGVHRAATIEQKTQRQASVDRVFSMFPVVSFDIAIARVHAAVGADLARKGIVIGQHDLMIAATALSLGYGVATRDERSFPKIPGLTVVRW